MSDSVGTFVPLIPRGSVMGTPYFLLGVAASVFSGLVPVGQRPGADDLRPTGERDGELVVEVGAWLTPGPHQLVIAAFDEHQLIDMSFPGVVMVTETDDPALL